MRVLWFTNTPSLASKSIGADPNLGGWISSLENQISTIEEIELGVAFPFGYGNQEAFSIGRTSYFTFPFSNDKGKLRGLRARWMHEIEPESEIGYYMSVIEQFKPDLIHIFGSERSFGLINTKIKIPIILQIQGNLTICLVKWFSCIPLAKTFLYANKKDLILGYGIFHQYYLTKKRANRERNILANCRYIIGRTDWDRRISRVLSPDSKYFHCDEVLRDQFYGNQWSLSSSNKVIIFSTLSAATYKGLGTILKTAWLLKSARKISFEWQVAGIKGTEEIVAIIEKASKLKFKNNNVLFKSSLNSDELISCLLSSKCYVHPSHLENSSNSVCEAMILGVPVIATYAGGTSSLLLNGVEGILVQDGDPYVLAGAIIELLECPDKMKTFSENARKRAIARHKPSVILENIITIYNILIFCICFQKRKLFIA